MEMARQTKNTQGLAFVMTNSYGINEAEDGGLERLTGPCVDKNNWTVALKKLNFDCSSKENGTLEDMMEFMETVSTIQCNEDSSNYVIFVFSGHGNANCVYSQDNKPLPLLELLAPLFEGTMAFKTKLIYIDACRDLPGELEPPLESIVPGGSHSKKCFLFLSTYLGGSSSGGEYGSHFSQEASKCILKPSLSVLDMSEALRLELGKFSEYTSSKGLCYRFCHFPDCKDPMESAGWKELERPPASNDPPPPSAVQPKCEVTTAPRAGMDEKIDRSLDILTVSEYRKGLIENMKHLGTVLDIEQQANAIMHSNGSIDDHLLEILNLYIREKCPTWRDFCTALNELPCFNAVREKIDSSYREGTRVQELERPPASNDPPPPSAGQPYHKDRLPKEITAREVISFYGDENFRDRLQIMNFTECRVKQMRTKDIISQTLEKSLLSTNKPNRPKLLADAFCTDDTLTAACLYDFTEDVKNDHIPKISKLKKIERLEDFYTRIQCIIKERRKVPERWQQYLNRYFHRVLRSPQSVFVVLLLLVLVLLLLVLVLFVVFYFK